MNSPFEYSPLYYYKANDMLKQLEHSRSSKELTVNAISPQLQFFDINDIKYLLMLKKINALIQI